MRRYIRVLCFILLTACSNNVENRHFVVIGDSIVARWIVEMYFPDFVIENKGKGAAHIDYLDEFSHKCDGENVVVLIGTNDLTRINYEKLDVYTERYVNALKELNASKLYVFSVFPRSIDSDAEHVNDIICEFNTSVKTSLSEMENVFYIDVFDMLCYEGKLNPQYSFDGVHLNSFGYDLISFELRRVLE